MTSGQKTQTRPALRERLASRLTWRLLAFWVVAAALLVGGWTWRPAPPSTAAPAPEIVSTNPACAIHRRPDPSGSLPHRVLQRVILDNGDSWLAMRAALTQLREHPTDSLYDGVFEQCIKFQYAPSSLLILDGMHSVFGPAALKNPVLNMISIGFFLIMLFAISEIFVLASGTRRKLGVLDRAVPVLFTLTFYPALKSIELGQIQTWLNSLFAVSVLLYLRGQQVWGGVLFGVVVTIKPQLGMFLPWALIRKDWPFVRGMGACAVVVMLLSLWRYGLTTHLDYARVLSVISRHGESYFANQSFNGLLLRALHLGPNQYFLHDQFGPYHPVVHVGTMLTSLTILGFALFWRRESYRTDRGLSLCLAALCFTIGSPIAWEHHYGILPVLFAVALGALLRSGGEPRGLWIALGAAWLLTAVRFAATLALANTSLNVLQSHMYFGALILLVLLHLLRGPKAGAELPVPVGVGSWPYVAAESLPRGSAAVHGRRL
jgi:hypothetical protein